jgi:hypothetical protein
MTPAQVLPAAPLGPPAASATPTPPQAPPTAPATPVAPAVPPAQVFQPPPDPALSSVPPPMPTIQAHDIDEDEDKIEKTIMPCRIVVPTTPQLSQPQHLGHTAHIPGQYQQLAGEDDAEHLDYIFAAGYDDLITQAIKDLSSDPKSLLEVRSQSDWPQWKKAMDRKILMLEKAGTWCTVSCPNDKNIVGSKWVFHVKHKANSSINKYKAHLVTQGFMQIYGVDFFKTYSPVARLNSIWLILAIAACNDWDIESFNFVRAYLNRELDNNKEIYMQSSLGYESDAKTIKWLQKSLYGLKQAGCKWYDILVCALTSLGFQTTCTDPGVFFACVDEHILILAIHVNNCILTGSSNELITLYKKKLNACYALTDLGPLHWLLGIKVTHNWAVCTISLSQLSYIATNISCFSLTNAKPCGSPMTPGTIYSKKDAPSNAEKATHMQRTPYRQAISSLMCATIATCPDITFAISILSCFLENLGDIHWDTVKHVFHYLQGMKALQLTFGGEWQDLEGYSDADGGTQEDRYAISGYTFLIDGGTIVWY